MIQEISWTEVIWKQSQKLQEEADEVPVFKDPTATFKSIESNAVGAEGSPSVHRVPGSIHSNTKQSTK